MSRETVVLDLPPTPPAYVEVCQGFSGSESKHLIAALRNADREPPEPPPGSPHDHEHAEETPREPVRLTPGTGHLHFDGQEVSFKHSSDAV